MDFLIHRRTRIRQLRPPRRLRRPKGRHHRPMRRRVNDHRLIQRHEIHPGETTQTALRTSHEQKPVTVLKLDLLLTMRMPVPHLLPVLVPQHQIIQLRRVLDQTLHPPEMLLRRLELMRRMHPQPLPRQKQHRQLPRLQHRTLPVLPRHIQTELEMQKPALVVDRQEIPERIPLPLIQLQPRSTGELDRLIPKRIRPRPNRTNPRPRRNSYHDRDCTLGRIVARLHLRCDGPKYPRRSSR